jgi:[ribosomal protein S5]-alanine N-acetyltransferase
MIRQAHKDQEGDHSIMKKLETERLILRTWSQGDLDDFYEYAKAPDVGPNAGWAPHVNKELSARILQSFIMSGDVWAIEYKQNHKAIGSLGLHEDKKREGVNSKMVGYALSHDYWGRGLMSEAVKCVIKYAFEKLELDVLSVYHYPSNLRSRRVIEKCGFKYEGTMRLASKLYDGTMVDEVCYSMTREEYFGK